MNKRNERAHADRVFWTSLIIFDVLMITLFETGLINW